VTAVSDGLSRLGRGTLSTYVFTGSVYATLVDLYNDQLVDLYPNLNPPGLVCSANATEQVEIELLSPGSSPISVLTELASSAPNSFLFEGLSGQITLYDQSYFRPSTWPAAPVVLTGDEIVDDWSMTKTIGEKVNSSEVVWTGGTAVDNDTLDQDNFGTYSSSISTYLVNEADADLIAERTLANFADPGWQISAITIPVHTLSTSRQNTITGSIQVGTIVDIPELYPGLPTRYVVQGISDVLGQTRFERTLYLADWTLLRPAETWDDVTSTLAWQDVNASIIWTDLVREWI